MKPMLISEEQFIEAQQMMDRYEFFDYYIWEVYVKYIEQERIIKRIMSFTY